MVVILSIVSLITEGNIWLPMMFMLGGTIGIPMALSYPWPDMMNYLIIVGLLLSFIATVYGFMNSKKIHGQILAVIGVIAWLFIGTAYGLGTGT